MNEAICLIVTLAALVPIAFLCPALLKKSRADSEDTWQRIEASRSKYLERRRSKYLHLFEEILLLSREESVDRKQLQEKMNQLYSLLFGE